MKLYYHPASGNCRRVVALANHIGFPLELCVVDVMTGAHKKPEYLQINPNGMVPTLDDNGFKLWESNAIIQYLAEKKGETTVWPKDPQQRADIARWQFWAAAHFGQAIDTLTFQNVFKKMVGMGDPEPVIVKSAEANIGRFGAVLEKHLENRDWIVGKGITLADFSMGAHLAYAEMANAPVKQFKNMMGWYERLGQIDAWKNSAPPAMGR